MLELKNIIYYYLNKLFLFINTAFLIKLWRKKNKIILNFCINNS